MKHDKYSSILRLDMLSHLQAVISYRGACRTLFCFLKVFGTSEYILSLFQNIV